MTAHFVIDLVAKSCLTLASPWTVAQKNPLSIGFRRQGFWSGLPVPSPEDLPDPGIELWSPALQVDSLPTEPSAMVLLIISETLHLLQGVSVAPNFEEISVLSEAARIRKSHKAV